jgi:hypothetical protein
VNRWFVAVLGERTMSIIQLLIVALIVIANAMTRAAEPIRCDLTQYKASAGLTATPADNLLVVSWRGDRGADLRARYTIADGQPVIRDLAVRASGGAWVTLGENLKPEYRVVTGVRRMSTQQADPLRAAGVELTPDVIAKNRWYAFWDAPLFIPPPPPPQGGRGQTASRVIGPPRTAGEIRQASASFSTSSCSVKTDGATLEVAFPGLTLGSFAGDLRLTVYRGTSLIRMDAVAKTNEEWVAYKYEAGLSGFSTALTQRVTWRDTGGHPQHYAFGGVKNETIVPLKAANRLLIAEGKGASLAAFPAPHEPRLHLVPQGPGGRLRIRNPPGGPRRGSAVRRELRAVQCAARHGAADGRVLLRQPGGGGSHPPVGPGIHARRHVQARSRLQDDGEPLPSAVHRPRPRVRILRHADAGSRRHEIARPQHRRSQ